MACLTVIPSNDFLCAHWFNSREHIQRRRNWWAWHASLHKVPKPYEVIWRA